MSRDRLEQLMMAELASKALSRFEVATMGCFDTCASFCWEVPPRLLPGDAFLKPARLL